MSDTVSRRRLTWQFIAFWLTWLIVQIVINSPIERHLSGWPQELTLDAIKLVVWLGGGWWFIHQTQPQTLAIAPREQWRPNWHFSAGYLIWGIVVVYLLGQFWLTHHGLRVSHSFLPEYWGRYFVVVGITEEFVFRGYFLNALLKHTSFAWANTLQALAFMSMHIPRYLTTMPPMSPTVWLSNLISVALLGALFGWLYVKSRSLWPGIIVHMTWDILVTLFS